MCSVQLRGAGAILTFLGGFQTQSLWLTDMAHHHLAIAVIFIIGSPVPHQLRDWSQHQRDAERQKLLWHSEGQFNLPHQGLYDTYNNSHFQLSIHLAALEQLFP